MPKRRTRRFAIQLADDSKGSRLEDLSEGGMRILSNQVFKIDQTFPTTIRSPDGPIAVKARIVRSCLSTRAGYKYDYGAQLTMASPEDELKMRLFVQHLSATVGVLPEEPGKEELEELQAQIVGLKDELVKLQDRHQAALSQQEATGQRNASDEEEDTAFQTQFSLERFEHLIEIGQPMVVTASDPAAGLVGKWYHLVADALTDPFDLESLSKSLRGVVPRKVIPETLFDFYDRNRIDFA